MKLIIIDKSVIRNIYSNDRKDTAYGTNGAPLIEHQNRIAPHPSGRSQNLGFAAMVPSISLIFAVGRSAGELNAPRPLDSHGFVGFFIFINVKPTLLRLLFYFNG